MSAGSGSAPTLVKVETPTNFDIRNALAVEEARTAMLRGCVHFQAHQLEQQNLLLHRLRSRSDN